ncbi:hypothetical protein HK405_008483 [Cladochytrium tenue]|nr:hypothetical protein HK405_008483 [Cladochytrium tenue]
MVLRRRAALTAIERAAVVVVRREDDSGSNGDGARRGAACGVLTGLSSSERLDTWRAALASGAENVEETLVTVGQTLAGRRANERSQRQRIGRAIFIAARLGPPDIEAALADIITGLPAEPCRCLGTAALFFWIDEDGNLIAQENIEDRDRLLRVLDFCLHARESSPQVAAVAQSLAPVLNHNQLLRLLAVAPSCLAEGGLPEDLRKPWMAVFCAALENYLPPPTGADAEVIFAVEALHRVIRDKFGIYSFPGEALYKAIITFKSDMSYDDMRAVWRSFTNQESVSQNVFETSRARVDQLEADGRAPDEAFTHMIEETLVYNDRIATIFSIMDCCLEILPTPATTLSAANAPLKPRLARALALALFRAVKEHATTVDLWRCIQRTRRLLAARPGLHVFPLSATLAVQALEAKLNECLRIQLVAPHVQALDDYVMIKELEVMLAGARGNWEQFVTVAFCETWEVELTRAPAEQLVERCFSELRRVAVVMYDALEAATQDS